MSKNPNDYGAWPVIISTILAALGTLSELLFKADKTEKEE